MLKEKRFLFMGLDKVDYRPQVTSEEVGETQAVRDVRESAALGSKEDFDDYKEGLRREKEAEVDRLNGLEDAALILEFTPTVEELSGALTQKLEGTGVDLATFNRLLSASPEEVDAIFSGRRKEEAVLKAFGVDVTNSGLDDFNNLKDSLIKMRSEVIISIASKKRDERIAALPDEYFAKPDGKLYQSPEYKAVEESELSLKEAEARLAEISVQFEEYEVYKSKLESEGLEAAIAELEAQIGPLRESTGSRDQELESLLVDFNKHDALAKGLRTDIDSMRESFQKLKAKLEEELKVEKARLEGLKNEDLLEEFPVSNDEASEGVASRLAEHPYVWPIGEITYEDYQALESANYSVLTGKGGYLESQDGVVDVGRVKNVQLALKFAKEGVRAGLAREKRDTQVKVVESNYENKLKSATDTFIAQKDQKQSEMDTVDVKRGKMKAIHSAEQAVQDQEEAELASLEKELNEVRAGADSERVEGKKKEIVQRIIGEDDEAPTQVAGR